MAISVVDRRQRVAPEQLPHLFRKYAGVVAGDQRNGLAGGLGLAICKGLVEAHGGRIWAERRGPSAGARRSRSRFR